MIVEETFYRPPELSREARMLPAATYNLAHVVTARGGSVFVPIRSMQYLAVLDAAEFIFVHREGRRLIEIAWQDFAPQRRVALDDPVAYAAVYYHPCAAATMRRLQPEFHRALVEFGRKRASVPPARVIKLRHGSDA